MNSRFETLQKTLGYRFSITQVAGETIQDQAYLRIQLANWGLRLSIWIGLMKSP